MWFRRDLRLADNPALLAAVEAGGEHGVLALFVLDPFLWQRAGAARRAFLTRCLRELDASIGGALCVRTGDPVSVVPEVVAAVDAAGVWCATDFGPYGSDRDESVAVALESIGAPLHRVGTNYAVPPGVVRNGSGAPYKVFTPFTRAWRAAGWPAAEPSPGAVRWRSLAGERVPAVAVPEVVLPEAGEAAAAVAARRFFEGPLANYDCDRDRPDLEGTSRLSPYLRWGCVHPRQLLGELDDRPSHGVFRGELCWREFYADVLHHQPDTARHSLQPAMTAMPVDEGPTADQRFESWAQGRTGFPFVDAGMRQLRAEAWMHNRVRMVVASFLVKDLHLDWRRGARWFMDQLVDGDLASNQHGWQWVAGTGTDASPYFRIFNPITQGRRFDPDGDYVRRWVPELRGVPGRAVHEPWKLAAPPSDYPAPIVDHAAERDEALWRYQMLRSGGGSGGV